ncbi:GrBNV gp75-like protein-like protein [Mauternbach virus]|uniref:GrBNV gp75-like protein-like protein n=1 Tax=Mauternbach virus TaxID=2486603 RepID=A0A3G3E8C6_9VIRU|nr:GrBNV gp75-like protein-like protein [Mauternbach virus]AYP97963.1 GrBNV gp75-like protein-like protein [Mauternbach virus]
MANVNDLLYTATFEAYIVDFCRVVSTDTNIAALSPIIELLKGSIILTYLMKDPSDNSAKACVRNVIVSKPHLPHDFLYKFLAIATMKISLTPSNIGFAHQSYNAKIIVNNLQPTSRITNLTTNSRQEQLRAEYKNAITYVKQTRMPPQALRLKFSEDLLPRCINAIGDLNQVIIEGNRSNGRQVDEFVRTVLK